VTATLKQAIKEEARRLGFILAGVTTPEPPPHLSVFEDWLMQGRNATMAYLSQDRSRARRADPRLILPECRSILVLAIPYSKPSPARTRDPERREVQGKIAAYAAGTDYHLVLPERLQTLAAFIEEQAGQPVANRWYTDTGPILERDMAQRAGLGWIGKNTCLINPKQGSYFLLSEILLDLELEPDQPFVTDHCGTCTRCIEACPTECILPDRTIDAGRCISYLTIELKDEIPTGLRPLMGEWVFGCDICQMVCPWNRFAAPEGDQAFNPREDAYPPDLIRELELSPGDFNQKFKDSPVQRARRRGYLRNVAVALGNEGRPGMIPALKAVFNDPEPLVREHAAWAIDRIEVRNEQDE
jgi:epoxyqueuosine reductase